MGAIDWTSRGRRTWSQKLRLIILCLSMGRRHAVAEAEVVYTRAPFTIGLVEIGAESRRARFPLLSTLTVQCSRRHILTNGYKSPIAILPPPYPYHPNNDTISKLRVQLHFQNSKTALPPPSPTGSNVPVCVGPDTVTTPTSTLNWPSLTHEFSSTALPPHQHIL